MKITTKQATEMKMTSTYAPPEGEGWEYDGDDYNLQTGEQNYFWTRTLKDIWKDTCYTLKNEKPKGEGRKFHHTSKGPSGQRRYFWRRTRRI